MLASSSECGHDGLAELARALQVEDCGSTHLGQSANGSRCGRGEASQTQHGEGNQVESELGGFVEVPHAYFARQQGSQASVAACWCAPPLTRHYGCEQVLLQVVGPKSSEPPHVVQRQRCGSCVAWVLVHRPQCDAHQRAAHPGYN